MFIKFKNFLLSNLLLSQTLFFSIFAILGLTYKGSGESSLYSQYLVLSSFFIYILFFREILIKRVINVPIILVLGFSIFLIFFILFAPSHNFVKSQTNLFFVLSLPSAFVGYIMARTKQLLFLKKSFIFLSLIVFVAVLRILPKLFSSSVIDLMDVFGGGQYQAFSYFCAFSFLTIFHQLINKSYSKNIIFLFYVVVILVLFLGVFLSGGRGGLLVVLLGTITLTVKKKGFLKFVKYSLFLSVFLYLFYLFSSESNFLFSDRFVESFERLFSFLSSDGIDMDGSSNRDQFYGTALSMIKKNLIIGYGFFGLVSSLGDYYPHNIFLEVFLQGGLLFFIFFIFFGFSFFYKLSKLIKLKKDEDFILIPTVYSLTILMFSSSYLIEPFFWFSFTYVFSYPYNLLRK